MVAVATVVATAAATADATSRRTDPVLTPLCRQRHNTHARQTYKEGEPCEGLSLFFLCQNWKGRPWLTSSPLTHPHTHALVPFVGDGHARPATAMANRPLLVSPTALIEHGHRRAMLRMCRSSP